MEQAMEIEVTAEELAQEVLSEGHLREAVQAVRTDGFVVLNDVVDPGHLDVLREKMVVDVDLILKAKDAPHNFVRGNVQQDPPPFAPFVFRDVVANPWVVQVTKAVLGAGVFNRSCSGNTNVPGSTLQPVHVDSGQLWPNLDEAHPAAQLVVNIALDEVTEANGSIELWPGSHLDMHQVRGDDIKVDPGLVEDRRLFAPPVRGNTRKGSVLVRDMRLWHRGTPNSSDAPRFMIAMVHNCAWMHRRPRFQYVKGCEPAFENDDLDSQVEFVDGPIDYLYRNSPYDYKEQ
jgi:hypothetical protein